MSKASLRSRRWGRRLLVASVALLLLTAVAIAGLRVLIGRQIAIASPTAVSERGYVHIGGAPQWIDIRGWDRTNPVILWLHGGPGFPILAANYNSFLPWERVFTVVHWHQRGAGLTYGATPDDAPPMTVDLMVRDGIEVAEHVRARLHKEKIIVIGHSWGSILGTLMVQRRPDLFAAYVGTGQMNSLEDDGRDLFAAAMDRAKSRSDTRAIEALTGVESLPLTDVRRMDAVRKWGATENVDGPLMLLIGPFLGPLISPGYPVSQTLSFRDGLVRTRTALFAEEQKIRLERDVPELKVPAFLFMGRHDWQVSTPAAVRFFERLRAPKKEIVLFDGGHFVHVFQSAAFLDALVTNVRPSAQ